MPATNVPIYTGTVDNPDVPVLMYQLSEDGAFLDAPCDGESAGGIQITGVIQSYVVPAGGGGATSLVYCADINAMITNSPSIAPSNVSVTGDYNIALAALSEVAVGAQEYFQFTFTMPITRINRGPRAFTIATIHQGGGTSNMTGVWNDSTTPLTVVRMGFMYNTLVATGGNPFLMALIGAGGITRIAILALGNN